MRIEQQRIINELGVSPTIDATSEIEKRSQFLADYLGNCGLRGFTLGISGGQDSLLAGLLIQKAIELRQRAGYDAEFHALLLPYGEQRDRDDAVEACQIVQPDPNLVHDINIQPATDAMVGAIGDVSDFDKGNIKARMRMIAHYAIAGQHQLLVVGTDHASETITGFFTKYGDGGADILPLSGLTKDQGASMLRAFDVPEKFYTKAPTADLLDGKPGQTDESELGLSYATIGTYLRGETIDEQDAKNIEARYKTTAHKRTMPADYQEAVN